MSEEISEIFEDLRRALSQTELTVSSESSLGESKYRKKTFPFDSEEDANSEVRKTLSDFLEGKPNDAESFSALTQKLISEDEPSVAQNNFNTYLRLISEINLSDISPERIEPVIGLGYTLEFKLAEFNRLIGKKSALEINRKSFFLIGEDDYFDIDTEKWITLRKPYLPEKLDEEVRCHMGSRTILIDDCFKFAFKEYIENPYRFEKENGEINFFQRYGDKSVFSTYDNYFSYYINKKILLDKIDAAGKNIFALRRLENDDIREKKEEEVISQLDATQISLFSENILNYSTLARSNHSSLFANYSDLFSQNQLMALSDVLQSFVGRIRTIDSTNLEEWQLKTISDYFQNEFMEIKGHDIPTKLSQAQSYNSRYIAADLFQEIKQVLKGELTSLKQNTTLEHIIYNVEQINENTGKALKYLSSIDGRLEQIGNSQERIIRQNRESLDMQYHMTNGVYALGRVISSFRFENHTLFSSTYAGPRLSFDNALIGLRQNPQVKTLN